MKKPRQSLAAAAAGLLAIGLMIHPAASQQAWRVEPFLQIGDATGDPDYEFGQIVGITVAEDGSVFVLDQQSASVRVFGADGVLIRSFGRKGSGPGEMANPVAMLDGPGDTLFVADAGAARFSLFTSDGSDAGGFPLMSAGGIPIRWITRPDGQLVAQIRRMGLPGAPTPAGGNSGKDVILLLNTDGSVADTLFEMEAGKTFEFSENSARFNFFSPEPVWTLAPDGVWYGVNDDYRITRYGPDGSEQAVASRPFERQAVTKKDQDVLLDAFKRLMRDNGAPPQAVEQLMSAVNFADNFPAYLQMLPGPRETLWVQHIIRPSELSAEELETFNPQTQLGSSTWDVFSPSGQFQGAVTMPDRFQPLIFQDDRAYGIWRDEYDVQYVMGLKLLR